ncbi:ubiquitin carboxyl-terminal hydrolase family protein, putative [Babesia bigemina]|uniref:Ubiquitin carboxyl-terminal hydrolase n=1 Tax=Babesia bigemina TaxID=5866 RepID=A0A061DDD8_BABBI|nr:ubiquitin carboxyl-terminal hydrolase family protein, putative [Babesia bigemina]CDR97299.1 ubiquitin carboxyl-terminal hydrolase family protein, putative [Babesia bigemina]|eukprot:XP_012769485.1 ubiquitin carboxyl-terminal hydrolase family protein, putative [Babesia bigemina]
MEDAGNFIRVTVKWMGKRFNDLEISLDDNVEVLKAQLYSLTGVPPDRQKVMYKGLITESTNLREKGLTNGTTLMLIGSPDKLVERTEPVRFLETMTPQEKSAMLSSAKMKRIPCGIMNLGNTCYFNAVFQFLQPVTELWEGIELLEAKDAIDTKSDRYQLTKSLLDMRRNLPSTLTRYVPLQQMQLLRRVNPIFNRTDEKTGVYMQQDAEECLSCLLSCINGLSDNKLTDELFGYTLSTTIQPKERSDPAATEGSSVTNESNFKLNCYMGTQLKSVGTLMDGIMISLNEDIVKFSEQLGTDVPHEKVARISTLPKYLIVHLVRFEWKQESKVSKTDAVKAKVCRRVNFERELDITSICTEELQQLLHEANAVAMQLDFNMGKTNRTAPFKGYEMYPGMYATGRYTLQSVVTHQGRTADGGHYVCWTKDNNEAAPTEDSDSDVAVDDGWLMFDDDRVTEYRWGNFDLCGGRSDYHIAVLLLYKAQCVSVDAEEAPAGADDAPMA